MNLIDTILSYIVPNTCVICELEGTPLCAGCSNKLSSPSANLGSDSVPVFAYTVYDDDSSKVIHMAKFNPSRSTALRMGQCLEAIVNSKVDSMAGGILTHCPTSKKRIKERGFDQAAYMTRGLARKLGIPALPLLKRDGGFRQLGATRNERIEHARYAYAMKRGYDIKGKHLLLVDDVMTTGATIRAAASVLLAAGAERVTGLVFAYKA